MLLGDEDRLWDSVRRVTERLGEDVARTLLAEGRGLSIDEAVALARQTIRAAADSPRS